MSPLPFNYHLANQVSCQELTPQQHSTSPRFRQHCDLRYQVMLKYPERAEFHSYAEYLHAGLLEGESAVTRYVPQPFRLRVNGRYYTPDCYVVRPQGREVIELKPRGEMNASLAEPLRHFFAQHDMVFTIKANETVFEHAQAARNWLEIVRILTPARDWDVATEMQAVWELLLTRQACTLGDLIDRGDRARTYRREIAVFRLLHQGRLMTDLDQRRLDFSSILSPCA